MPTRAGETELDSGSGPPGGESRRARSGLRPDFNVCLFNGKGKEEMRRGFLVILLILSLCWFLGCAEVDGEAGIVPRDKPCAYVLTPDLPPAVPGIVQDTTVDIFVSSDPRCYTEACEKSGDCNTQCVRVDPMHAQIFYHPNYKRGVSAKEAGYTPGLPREARWHVQCAANPTCLKEDSREECVAARRCLNERLAVRIRPAKKTPEQKAAAFAKAGFSRRMTEAAKACAEKTPRGSLFNPEGDGEFLIPGPNNMIFSGPPIDPDFDKNGCPGAEEGDGAMMEWYYDVELLRGDKVIMRLDPEIWVTKED